MYSWHVTIVLIILGFEKLITCFKHNICDGDAIASSIVFFQVVMW
jgi:hypothetical protein